MTRNDLHSPKYLVTEDYEYVFAYDSGAGGALVGIDMDWWAEIQQNMAGVHEHGQCDHCGARLRYIGILKHKPTGEYIEVGETCLENRFSRATQDFQFLRKQAKLNRQKQAALEKWEAFMADHPEVDWVSLGQSQNHFVKDVLTKGATYGDLTEKQLAAIVKADAKEKEPKEPEPNWLPVPTEKGFQVEGKVLAIKSQEGYHGWEVKMLVQQDTIDGAYKLWGTVPKAIGNVERGATVRLIANVEPSKKDNTFGLFRRPRQATILQEVNA